MGSRFVRVAIARLALTLFGIGLAVGLPELGARWIAARKANREAPYVTAFTQFFQADPELDWVHRPAVSGEYFNSAEEFRVQVVMNSRGLRDREFDYAKPGSVFRVLLLGDSYIEAMHVPLEDTAAKVIERSLQEAGIAAEVINAGVTGYSPGHELLWYQREGRQYQPDLVLLALFVGNDFEDEVPGMVTRGLAPDLPRNLFYEIRDGTLTPVNLANSLPAAGDAPALLQSMSLAGRVDAWLVLHSAFYGMVRPALVDRTPLVRQVLLRLGLLNTAAPVRPLYARSERKVEYETAVEVIRAELIALRGEVEADGGRLAVVVIPDWAQVHPEWLADQYPGYPDLVFHYDLDWPDRASREILDEVGVAYLFLRPTFTAAISAGGDPLYFRHDRHWDVAGNRLAGETIAGWLVNEGLVASGKVREEIPTRPDSNAQLYLPSVHPPNPQ